MKDELVAQLPPINRDADGVFRVGGTRVRLETVLWSYENGCTPEEIVLKYPSVRLPDVYAVISYYYFQREAVEEYLARRQSEIRTTAREIEAESPTSAVRARLLNRFPLDRQLKPSCSSQSAA
jgi:uncharacterized protein (DUF433 family)